MIKICHIANTDIAVKFLLINQLKFLKSKGFNVHVVCANGSLIKEIEQEGIKVKVINFNRGFNLFSHIGCLFKLCSYFKKEKFDIVHTHTPVPGLLGQLAAKKTGVPIIINTIHGFYFSTNSGFIKKNILILIEKISAKYSDLIFSVSKGIKDTLIKEKICEGGLVKYLGRDINMNRFDPEKFPKTQGKNIGIVGRLVKEKGYIELFEAFKIVNKKYPEAKLFIVGPEEKKRDKIDKDLYESDNIIFLGQRRDVEAFYSKIDIFVLPSYREGIGASLLEASAMTKPVIATDIQGCREAVDNGKTGILVPLKDINKLAEAIIYMLENPEKAREMGRAGREKIKREFSQEIVFNRLETEYNRLIKEKIK